MYYCISTVVQFEKGVDWVQWKLDKDRPICPQIVETICVAIASGELEPQQKLMSVREFAVQAGVNPNTVQKALETLERLGIIYSVRGSGSFVAEDNSVAKNTLERIISERTAEFFAQMSALGFDTEKTKKYIEEWKDNE